MRTAKYSSGRRTEEAIRLAFAELVWMHGSVNKITAVMLAKQAHITRSTFYLHYDSVDAVANDIATRLIDGIFISTEKITTLEQLLKHAQNVFLFFKKNEKFYKLLFSADTPLPIIEHINNTLREKMIELIHSRGVSSPKLELNASFFADGATYMVLRWLRKEDTLSIEDIEWFLSQKLMEWYKEVLEKAPRLPLMREVEDYMDF